MEPLRFDDTVAIITGATRGIGRAHAALLSRRGARVVISGRDAEAAAQVVSDITAAGGDAIACVVDITAKDAGAQLVRTALDRFGRLDIIISNAGAVTRTDILQTDEAGLQAQLELDILGPVRLIQAAWRGFVDQGHGHIVLTSSSGAFGGSSALPYAAAKAAAIGLARSLAAAGAADGIKVNAITPFGFSRLAGMNPRLSPAQVAARSRLAPPELVAAGVAALVHHSCPVSGELFAIGAGRMTRIFLAETNGRFNAALTPEDVAAHWDEVVEPTDARAVGFDHVASFYANVPGWLEAISGD